MNDFGESLKKIRKEKKISQRKLAELVGIDYTYISKIENGTQAPPSEEVIKKISKILDIDTNIFILNANRIPSEYQETILKYKDVKEFHEFFHRISNHTNVEKIQWEKILKLLDSFDENKNIE